MTTHVLILYMVFVHSCICVYARMHSNDLGAGCCGCCAEMVAPQKKTIHAVRFAISVARPKQPFSTPKQLFQVLVYDSYNILLLNHGNMRTPLSLPRCFACKQLLCALTLRTFIYATPHIKHIYLLCCSVLCFARRTQCFWLGGLLFLCYRPRRRRRRRRRSCAHKNS